jgi:hypothetical protein
MSINATEVNAAYSPPFTVTNSAEEGYYYWCDVNFEKNANYRLTLIVPSGADFDLYIQTSKDYKTGVLASSTGYGNEVIEWSPAYSGTYYVIVDIYSGSSTYTLKVELVSSSSTSSGETISKHFTWTYDGSTWTWDLEIPKSLYDSYQSVSANQRLYYWYDRPGYFTTTSDPYVRAMAQALHDKCQELGYGTYDEVSFILAFIQCLRYTKDVNAGFNEYPRFPLETLVNDGGDCEDTSILFVTLIEVLNYDGLYFILDTNGDDNINHCAAGVYGSLSSGAYMESNGRKYYYCETTGDGYHIGQLPTSCSQAQGYIFDPNTAIQYRA